MIKLNWTVFVSQTGSEIEAICRELGIVPSLLISNNPKKLKESVTFFLKENGCKVRSIPFNPTVEHYLDKDILDSNVITLHGYLRILPGEMLVRYSPKLVYNGHPGLIAYYPELKGKDPQERAWMGNYPTVGSVIHVVTPGVDEGEVIRFDSVINTASSLDNMYEILRETSLKSWIKFLRENIFKLELTK